MLDSTSLNSNQWLKSLHTGTLNKLRLIEFTEVLSQSMRKGTTLAIILYFYLYFVLVTYISVNKTLQLFKNHVFSRYFVLGELDVVVFPIL